MHTDHVDVAVALHSQFETLWHLPPLDSSLSTPKDLDLPPQFILVSDQTTLAPWRPGRGSGVFRSDFNSFVVPKSHILLEAFLRICARDIGKLTGSFAMAIIAYMEEYVDDDEFLDGNQLPEPLKTFLQGAQEGKEACSPMDAGIEGGSRNT